MSQLVALCGYFVHGIIDAAALFRQGKAVRTLTLWVVDSAGSAEILSDRNPLGPWALAAAIFGTKGATVPITPFTTETQNTSRPPAYCTAEARACVATSTRHFEAQPLCPLDRHIHFARLMGLTSPFASPYQTMLRRPYSLQKGCSHGRC